ncbi:PepSY-associated TM helix domain-containing protein [Bradyrhizobium sp. 5.13L]
MSGQEISRERVYERKPVLWRWLFVHKWSSLICTLFLLLICITGLPLVLREEINSLVDDALPYAQVPEGTPNVSLDRVVDASRKLYPVETIISVFVDDDEPKIMVYMASSWEAFNANRKSLYSIRFDAHTGDVLKQTKPFGADGLTFLQLMLTLHRDLFAGLPGELFLGGMALLFIAAIVSGIAIYGPFMRKLDFGTVRLARSRRLKWLDLHNLLGVVTLGWARSWSARPG